MRLEIKILGTGCPRCRTVAELVNQVLEENNIEGTVRKVEDIGDIMAYGIMLTPGIVINDKVKFSGGIPKKEDILKWIKEEQ